MLVGGTWRNLGHLEREESWLRYEVRSLLCHVHERQSSQDLAQLLPRWWAQGVRGGCSTRLELSKSDWPQIWAVGSGQWEDNGNGNGNGNLSFVTWKARPRATRL